jgi:hypothetical protein
VRIFGLQITKAENEKEEIRSFAPPPNEDGAIEIAPIGGVYGTYLDLSGQAKDEAEIVTRYRSMERDATVRRAIEDIVNEAIVVSETEKPVKIDVSSTQLSVSLRKRIEDEFDGILKLLDFSNKGYDIFQRWYVDGRLKYHAMIDEKSPEKGIKELRYIDPRKIRRIREIVKKKLGDNVDGFEKLIKQEYYIYSEKGFAKNVKNGQSFDPTDNDIKGIRIAKDSIVDVNSGLYTEDNSLIISHLDSAVKPLNQLQMLENASIIYRLARAPERRVFYLDVGDLPKAKAEQYVHDMMTKHKNKLVYDSTTGEVRDDRRFMTMLEDFWLPRREGGRGTEITTLPGAANLGEMDDINYFKNNLYESLNVPSSRLSTDSTFSLGKTSEITRDEVKFAKFILRLRNRFAMLFDGILEKQLVLKKILTMEEWLEIKNVIRYNFIEDNHYQELKRIEILNGRLEALRNIQDYVGIYYSKAWVRKNVLFLMEEEIDELGKEMEDEKITEPPPEPDGDANDDGFADRHGKSLLNGEEKVYENKKL